MKEVFRIGDEVRIINPEKFVRCGYPMDFEEIKDQMMNENGKKIREIKRMIMEAVKGPPIEEFEDESYFDSEKPFSKNLKERIVEIFASAYMNYHGFGGNERKIYAVASEGIYCQDCIVMGKKIVITGERCGRYDSYGNIPCLENRKSHIILKVMPEKHGQSFWIEAKNVEKVG